MGEEALIDFRTEGVGPGLCVAPMLLLPLVENGFKHGIKGDVSNTFLKMRLAVEGADLRFTVENNKGTAAEDPCDGARGVGLQNIRSRLHLIYPGRHALRIDDSGPAFRVELEIRGLDDGGRPKK